LEIIAFSVVAGMLLVGVVALAGVVFQLLRQQGFLLLRLEAVERGLAQGEAAAAASQNAHRPAGLPLGEAIPSFQLPDFTGRLLGLDDFPGKRLLVHWSPECGFCEQIASELGGLEAPLRQRRTEVVLVSWGNVEANRSFSAEHGLRYPILLQEGSEQISAFAGLGTPVAYALDEEARVVEPLAIGADEVLELARGLRSGRSRLVSERPLKESRLERSGLRAGAQAPAFTLPDVAGESVSLEDFRGRPVLLVFSDPGCGPCNALGPKLAHIDQGSGEGGLQLLIISRGTEQENRRKAEEQGIRFPVLVQPGWRVSKAYGIFETPVAFLVDREGVIAHDVARGEEQILALARESLVSRKEVRREATARA
jgi:peroxiredoxin